MELEKLKLLLGLEVSNIDNKDNINEDTDIDNLEVKSKENSTIDTILEFIIADIEEIIKNYCHVDEVPEGLLNTSYRMAIDLYRNENIGNESSSSSVASINEEIHQYHLDNMLMTILKKRC